MFDNDYAMRFKATPAVTGTGLFDQYGTERKSADLDDKGRPFAIIARCCGRCAGMGGSEAWGARGSNTGWTCYDCGGTGNHKNGPSKVRLFTTEALEKKRATDAKRLATIQAKRQAAAAKRQAAIDAIRDTRKARIDMDPFAQKLRKYADRNEFIGALANDIYERDLSDKTIAAAEAAIARIDAADHRAATARHVGTVGARIPFEGIIAKVRCFREPTSWEPGRYLVTIDTSAGELTWWAGRDAREGATVAGTCTIKSHDFYKDVPQTVIKNPRFREDV